ncbi:ABC transporter [Phytophthora megakarya]|uniref:ABC transporter n=1 Tax=Phytophthora megakarya TaxID=4795 RepID=A0A225WBX9_9STRA|nr:ABC transporter [Phytophthora megakarya]
MTLVLGQPGSGKSALMKVLSGQFPMDKNIVLEGEITYNGTSRDQLLCHLPQFVSYVDQTDIHFPMLSVRETLEFAHTFSGGKVSTMQDVVNDHPDTVIQHLGLQSCQNTVVGDTMLRGISGGEKKRVTTGEMEFGNKLVCMLDEISTGLDSATTFDIINSQRSFAQNFHKTVVISLLQPAPEVFALFDNVLLLNDGEVLYHGPRGQVVEYFKTLGFVCPPHRDIADFLVELSTDEQYKYQVERREAFARSGIRIATLTELYTPIADTRLQDMEAHVKLMPEFHQSFWAGTLTLLHRQFLVTVRNKAFLRGKAVLLLLMGLLYASVFNRFDFEDVQVVMGIIFFSVMYLALAQTPMLPVYFAAREVSTNNGGPISTALRATWSPWVFVQTAGAYILFELLLFLTNLAFSAFFFYISCVTVDVHMAKPLAMKESVLSMLTAELKLIAPSGELKFDQAKVQRDRAEFFPNAYFRTPAELVTAAKEDAELIVTSSTNYCTKYGMNMGEYYLNFYDIQTERSWILYGVLFNLVTYFLFMFLAYRALEYKRIETPMNLVAPKKKLTMDYVELATPKAVEDCKILSAKSEIAVTVPNREKNFVPVTVAFQDLWYTVPNPRNKKESVDLLKGVSGFALPGKMTALMGATGAGKTTLMDVIAGRKTGSKFRGKILLNGFPATDLAIRRCTGYCEQLDIHADSATIREALTFSAFLRQGSDVSSDMKYDSVTECLELLELDSIADRCIRGCSVEQLKRLTIGVELAAQPSVIFLDEPTSGLDARATKVIMNSVRKVANSGRTILCTIHQPSTEVFMLFDSLLLLKKGGETVFFGNIGDRCCNLIDYLENIPGVPTISADYNPATWMLEVIGAGVDHTVDVNPVDFAEAFTISSHKIALEQNLSREGVAIPVPGQEELSFANKYAASNLTQAYMITMRFFHMYWRLPTYNWTRIVVYTAMGFLFGLVFVGADYNSYQQVNSGLGMLFCTTAFLGIVSLNSAVPVTSEGRASFYRERASHTYNSFWYFFGFTVAEIPYVLVSSLFFTIICLPLAGFTDIIDLAFYWLNLTLHVLCQIYLGQLLSFAMPSVEVAALLGVLFNSIFVLFMGFNPPASAIPQGYKWLFVITPQRYSFMLFSALLFGYCPDDDYVKVIQSLEIGTSLDMTGFPRGCHILQKAPQAVGRIPIRAYLDSVFDIRHNDIHHYMFINIMMTLVLRFLAILALRFINHQKK